MNHVATLRIARNWTQQQLAAAAGVSLRTITYTEGCTDGGKRLRPPTKRAILHALGKNYSDIAARLEVFPE